MEADSLRWSLLVIGSLVIVGLAVHGIWISRKNSEKKTQSNKGNDNQQFQPSGWQSDEKADSLEVSDELSHSQIIEDPDLNFEIKIEHEPADLADTKTNQNEFDDLGIGAVRVVSSDPKSSAEVGIDEHTENNAPQTQAEVEPTQVEQPIEQPEPVAAPTSKIYASVVTQPKPEFAANYSSLAAETVAISQQEKANNKGSVKVHSPQFTSSANSGNNSVDNYQAPEPPPFLLKKDPAETNHPDALKQSSNEPETTVSTVSEANQSEQKSTPPVAEKLSLSEQARNLVKRKKTDSAKKRREPKIAEDQMRIDFDDQPMPEKEAKPTPKVEAKESSTQQQPQQEVLVLNVKSADDNPIYGSALLPMLLTLGFKFGDQDIFHRHVNSNGKGPVLFSLANMFKPGNFDIDNLENFTTQGISLFMILPIEGEPHQVFNMMHNAARKIAEEFSAQIYDGKRTLLTKQSLQQYVEKIREFERQRLLKG